MISDSGLAPYRLLVFRRSPVQSRPPGAFRRVYQGTYYEVWERIGTPIPGQTLRDRLPLGEPPYNSAVPECNQIQALSEKAGPDGTLLAQPPDEHSLLDLSGSSHSDAWNVEGTVFTPHGEGTLRANVEISAPGRYRIWVGGDIHSQLSVRIAGQTDSARMAINVNRYQPFGPFQLNAGNQQIEFRSAGPGLAPGSGTDPTPLGPVILQRVETVELPTISLPSSDYQQLCNVPWDWIEAYG
jgi:hypothetical protein